MFWFNKPEDRPVGNRVNHDQLRRQHDRLVDQAQRALSSQRAAYGMGDTEGGHQHGVKAHEFTSQAMKIYSQLPKPHQEAINQSMMSEHKPKIDGLK